MTAVTTIDLIRHGEPVGGSRYRGHIDDPLSDKGWAQMRAAVGEQRPWDAIVSSTLCRCADFARELAARHNLPLTFEPRFKEIGFGAWEGRTAAELTATDAELLRRFWSDPIAHRPPGAEPLDAFGARVTTAWADLLERHAGSHVLVVAHAGTIRMVVRHVLGMPLSHMFRIDVPNAAITRIRVEGRAEAALARLVFHAGMM